MLRLIKRRSHKTGLPPGTLVHVGERRVEKPRIRIIDYDETQLEEKEAQSIEECFPFKDKPTITWINIDGIHEPEIIEKIGNHFLVHPLVLEDILNTGQRPKLEESKDYLFIVLKMLQYDETTSEINAEQVSLIVGSNFVISFQESEGDVFDHVRERIRKTAPRVRFMGADYLGYALVDAVVDGYFSILENLGEQIESLEDKLLRAPSSENLASLHELKRELVFMRRSVWPLREVVGGFDRLESELVHDFTRPYLRDLYEHAVQVIDTVETFRDMVSGLLDVYLSSVSNRMNEVMKVLTIIATIFIPLTFIAGIYGMNFEFMPELEWHWGYFAVLLIMTVIVIFMAFYFRRKKWL
jgi:magnesium transporter